MKRGEKWFPKNYEQIFDLKNIWSQSFSIRTSKGRAPASELVLLRRGLPSEIALQGGSLESKIVYRGVGADFEKPKIYFRQQRPDNPPPPWKSVSWLFFWFFGVRT